MTKEEFDDSLRDIIDNDGYLADGRKLTEALAEHDPELAEKNRAVVRAVEDLVAYARTRLEKGTV